jgi:hypothetical protein
LAGGAAAGAAGCLAGGWLVVGWAACGWLAVGRGSAGGAEGLVSVGACLVSPAFSCPRLICGKWSNMRVLSRVSRIRSRFIRNRPVTTIKKIVQNKSPIGFLEAGAALEDNLPVLREDVRLVLFLLVFRNATEE